jgi:hypothetical protein
MPAILEGFDWKDIFCGGSTAAEDPLLSLPLITSTTWE